MTGSDTDKIRRRKRSPTRADDLPATLRAFIAIDLPAEVKDFVAGLQADLRRSGLRIRWVRPGNLHLTLRFLGDVAVEDCESVAAAMRGAGARVPPFDLSARGLGVFPGVRKPRVVWVGLAGELPVLATLQRHMEEGLTAAGFERETRPFRAHLTVGRVSGALPARKLAAAIEALAAERSRSFRVERFHLYRSELRPSGAVYTRLQSVAVEGDAGRIG